MAGLQEQNCIVCDDYKRLCLKEDCIFSTLFPAEDKEKKELYFMIKQCWLGLELDPFLRKLSTMEDRKEAIRSLIWQANAWRKNPLRGPLGEFQELKQELLNIEASIAEGKVNDNELKDLHKKIDKALGTDEDDETDDDFHKQMDQDRKLPPKKRKFHF